jgi:hypothetical protein
MMYIWLSEAKWQWQQSSPILCRTCRRDICLVINPTYARFHALLAFVWLQLGLEAWTEHLLGSWHARQCLMKFSLSWFILLGKKILNVEVHIDYLLLSSSMKNLLCGSRCTSSNASFISPAVPLSGSCNGQRETPAERSPVMPITDMTEFCTTSSCLVMVSCTLSVSLHVLEYRKNVLLTTFIYIPVFYCHSNYPNF